MELGPPKRGSTHLGPVMKHAFDEMKLMWPLNGTYWNRGVGVRGSESGGFWHVVLFADVPCCSSLPGPVLFLTSPSLEAHSAWRDLSLTNALAGRPPQADRQADVSDASSPLTRRSSARSVWSAEKRRESACIRRPCRVYQGFQRADRQMRGAGEDEDSRTFLVDSSVEGGLATCQRPKPAGKVSKTSGPAEPSIFDSNAI